MTKSDEFLTSAQLVLKDHDVVYLHNAEGYPVAALLSMDFYKQLMETNVETYNHGHLEVGEEMPVGRT